MPRTPHKANIGLPGLQMLEYMSMQDIIDSRVALLLRHRLESGLFEDADDVEKDLRDIQGGRIPREIWQQRLLKPGFTLMSPIGRYSVDVLDDLLFKRSKKIQGNPDRPRNVFPFQKLMESWLRENIQVPPHQRLQGNESDDSDVYMMDVVTSRKNSRLRWLTLEMLGSCEVNKHFRASLDICVCFSYLYFSFVFSCSFRRCRLRSSVGFGLCTRIHSWRKTPSGSHCAQTKSTAWIRIWPVIAAQ
jgi:hypothetical protein